MVAAPKAKKKAVREEEKSVMHLAEEEAVDEDIFYGEAEE